MSEKKNIWKVIISDDSEEMHAVTKLSLENFTFEKKQIVFLSAYNAVETKKLIEDNPDTAVIILDVVMEKETSGLEVVKYIRNNLKNKLVRIILRTGQPGQAPQKQVIMDFDINDYKEKIELTDKKLFTTVVTALRSYKDLVELEKHKNRIEKTLREKEVLLKEIHHRVKNNLQIISSLLNMQSSKVTSNEALEMFNESRDRVKSMALIHEKLYQSEDFSKIEISSYIKSLTEELCISYNYLADIKLNLKLEKVFLDIEKAIPCGLILNELITNSLKHAFNDNDEKIITIKLHSEKRNHISITIEDNGKGIPDTVDFNSAKTLGLQLVKILTEQISGKLSLNTKKGTKVEIEFKN